MSDAAQAPPPPPPDIATPQSSSVGNESVSESRPVLVPEDRSELLQRARTFLTSSQVAREDVAAKRKFLVDKGLNDAEIEGLLRDTPVQAPLVPPRTYPQPPPSNLPSLLVGILRIATWVAGSSAALLLIYFRFIYPRIAQTFHARLSLRMHHKGLLSRLASSIEELKAAQNEMFAVLPPPPTYTVEPPYTECKTLDDVSSAAGESREVPHVLLLERAVAEIASKKEKPTTEAIFQLLEAKFPWIQAEAEGKFESELWDVLSSSVLFEQTTTNDVATWSFKAPPLPSPSPLQSSLSALRGTLPGPSRDLQSIRKTSEALSNFTGYMSSQLYAMPQTLRYSPSGLPSVLSPEEEEIRREIRALKGLMLNRRSFLPPRPTSAPSVPSVDSSASA